MKSMAVPSLSSRSGSWNAVFSLAVGVSGLVIAEFLPVGVLTSIAHDLNVTEGMAGQAVTATSIFAVLTGLSIAYLTRKVNRRRVLLSLSLLLTCSNVLVAIAPSFPFLLLGRVSLGVAVGGFWSMATAITDRLVPDQEVPKALSIIFGASSFSGILAAPLGSYWGNIIGWRNVFFIAAAVGLAAYVWQLVALPSLSPIGKVKLSTTIEVLRAPQLATGLLAIALIFGGRFASFTYLRPFLERTTGLSVSWISGTLLTFGLSYFVGNWFAPGMIRRNIRFTLLLPPIVLTLIAVGLLLFGTSFGPTLFLIFLWGAIFGPVVPSWSTWVTKRVPEYAETSGGLFVAAIQSAATLGALVGGIVFDFRGSTGVFILSGVSWLLAWGLVYWKIKNPLNAYTTDR